MFEFNILAKDKKTKARGGEFNTPHGKLLTPELAFVATEGELKSIPKEILPKLPVNLIIVNTFHLWTKQIRPIRLISPIHDFANFQKPIMSDSGGFQVFSMGFSKIHRVGKVANIFPGEQTSYGDKNNLLVITEKGVTFPFNGKKITLTPKKSIELQKKIGADIIFAFDECTSPLNSYEYTKKALGRTHEWLKRCLTELKKAKIPFLRQSPGPYLLGEAVEKNGIELSYNPQALFGIVQGGYFEDLRKESAQFVGNQDVSGFGIGGSLGRTKEDVFRVLEWTIPLLPEEKPRHLLGIGQVRDIFESVQRGVDLFDCVIPTREARHRVLYTKKGRINIKKMRNVNEVLEKHCKCLTCIQSVKYDQLAQLFQLKDPRGFFFATVHNIQFYADLMKKIREAIQQGKFSELKEKVLLFY
ncbi:tRNA-guanine transglycosylase, partial [Candidatus Roizmanbacteria bacterium]|nr:tRNA-guanine transglycosylase [Candidatus Roizmanbacteria bacterium]